MKSERDFEAIAQAFLKYHPEVLASLLIDQTTNSNIIWATDDYAFLGEKYSFASVITADLISGDNEGLIKPRVKKILQLQSDRSREMAEVFTPSWVVNLQNNAVDDGWFGVSARRFNSPRDAGWETNYYPIHFPETGGKSWRDYVQAPQLEVSCGEAPYLTSRYDAVTGASIPPKRRIGLLDRKLRVIGENCLKTDEWMKWAIEATKSIYGFEWQGDSLLLARQNIFLTVVEHFYDKFDDLPNSDFMQEIARIISWNLWQMDGIKYVIPKSCHDTTLVSYDLVSGEDKFEVFPCPGCSKNNHSKHNGIYAYIMDWKENKKIRFMDVLGRKKHA